MARAHQSFPPHRLQRKAPSLPVLFVLLPSLGCAYAKDRALDLADPFTFIFVSAGLGANVRATHFLQGGLSFTFTPEGNPGFVGRECDEHHDSGAGVEVGLAPLAYARGGFERSFTMLLGRTTTYGGLGDEPVEARYVPRKLFAGRPHRRLFDFGVSVQALFGFELAFNPLEALDFILGFTTLDILGDDTAGREAEGASPKSDGPQPPEGLKAPGP